jgi:hypothetical protein
MKPSHNPEYVLRIYDSNLNLLNVLEQVIAVIALTKPARLLNGVSLPGTICALCVNATVNATVNAINSSNGGGKMQPFNFAIGLGLILITSQAMAGKDWKLVEDVDAVLQTPVCRAETTMAKAKLPVELSLSFPKDPTLLPIVYVKITGLQNRSSNAQLRFAKKEFQPLFLLKEANSAQEPDIYWYAPKDLARLIEIIKNSGSLDIAFNPLAPAPVPVRFSLSGATDILDRAEKCLKAKELYPKDFLKALNQDSPFTGPLPAQITAGDVLDLTQKAYLDYQAGKLASAALVKLRAAMKPLTDKEATAQKVVNVKQSVLDATNKKLNEQQNLLADKEQELARFTTELPQLQNDKTLAEQDTAAKKAIYDPAKALLAPFEKDVSAKTQTLANAKKSVFTDQKRISSDKDDIETYRSRASRIRKEIPGLKSELSGAESTLSRAESDVNSYNVSWEAQRIRDSDFRYRNAQSDAESKRNEAQRYGSQASSDQGAVSSAQSALSSCQSQQPVKDCSNEQSALSRAESQLNSDRNQEQQAEWAASNADSDARRYASDDESQAQSKYNDLENIRNQAQSNVNSISSALSDDESELASIENSKLPRLQSDLQKAQAALPGLQQEQAAAEQGLTAAQQSLSNERLQIGFDQIEKNYQDSVAKVKLLGEQIVATSAGIKKDTKDITTLRPIVAKLVTTSAKETADRDASQSKLSAIQTQLSPQRAQEATAVAQVDEAKTKISEKRALYQAEVKALSPSAN